MKTVNWSEINELAVQKVGKPAVYISNGLKYNHPEDDVVWNSIFENVKQHVSEASYSDTMSTLVSGGMFFFDTDQEATTFYAIFNKAPVYSSAVYAALYIDGKNVDENT